MKWGTGGDHGTFHAVLNRLHRLEAWSRYGLAAICESTLVGLECRRGKVKRIQELGIKFRGGVNIPEGYMERRSPQKPDIWTERVAKIRRLLIELEESLT